MAGPFHLILYCMHVLLKLMFVVPWVKTNILPTHPSSSHSHTHTHCHADVVFHFNKDFYIVNEGSNAEVQVIRNGSSDIPVTVHVETVAVDAIGRSAPSLSLSLNFIDLTHTHTCR